MTTIEHTTKCIVLKLNKCFAKSFHIVCIPHLVTSQKGQYLMTKNTGRKNVGQQSDAAKRLSY